MIAARFDPHVPLFEVDLVAMGDEPIVIPPEGGEFSFSTLLRNNMPDPRNMQAWATVIQPDGTPLGPLRLISLNLQANSDITFTMSQNFPAAAAPGNYLFIGLLGHHPDTITARDTLRLLKQEPGFPR